MKTAVVDGMELSLVDQGSGPPVVLLHGFPLDHSMWDAQIEALVPLYRVIAPDQRGFGKSRQEVAKMPLGSTLTMQRLADDLDELLDVLQIDEPVTLCGLSMGGYIALEFYRRHRARLGKLALLDTRSENDLPEVAAGRREMAERVLCEGPEPLVEGMMPRLFAEATTAEQPEIVEQLRRVMLDNRPNVIAAALLGMAERANMTPMLETIDCPTLVLVGQLDAITPPEEMRSMAEAIPNARFECIAGSGHMSTMERPNEVNRILKEFLAT